jgi:hypothetical protein
VLTAKPNLSSFTTQRCWQSASGISAETVFQSRSRSAPTILEPGKVSTRRCSKSSRQISRVAISPDLKELKDQPDKMGPEDDLSSRPAFI